MVKPGEPTELKIDDEKMERCPICQGTKIRGPHHKRQTAVSPVVLAYTCITCEYTQYVHTEDSKFLKSVGVKPT